jgi:hypothetical protein
MGCQERAIEMHAWSIKQRAAPRSTNRSNSAIHSSVCQFSKVRLPNSFQYNMCRGATSYQLFYIGRVPISQPSAWRRPLCRK